MAGKRPARASQQGKPNTNKPGVTPVGRGLNGKPFYNQANYNKSKAAKLAGGNPGYRPLASMPGHPSGNPTHVHGPSSTGTIKGAKPRM